MDSLGLSIALIIILILMTGVFSAGEFAIISSRKSRIKEMMKKKGEEGLVWTEENLTSYLKDPKAFVPGNKMIFVGLKKDDEEADVIAYLKSLENP